MKPDLSQVNPLEYNLATRVSIGDALTRSATLFPDRVAVVDRGEEVTYRRLDDAAERLARSLLDLGVPQQTPVAIMMGNSWQFLATYYACAKAGIVAMPLNVLLSPSDHAWMLGDAGTQVVVADAQLLPVLEQALPEAAGVRTVIALGAAPAAVQGREVLAWDALATAGDGSRVEVIVDDRDTVQCLYTSGTTSRPKGVLVSHVSLQLALLSDAIVTRQGWGDQRPVMLVVLPMFHTTALNTLAMPTLVMGGTVVFPGPFDPGAVLDAVAERRVTHLMMLPMMHAGCVAAQAAAPRDLSSVQTAVYAMAPMPRSLLEQVAAMYPNAAVILGSGQTEVVPATVMQWPTHQQTAPESWGPSVPTVTTRTMDALGGLNPADGTGEIVYRGPNVSSGYWNNASANATAFAHGWFHSGDIGHVDGKGVVWFTDRLKDIIKSGGENVSSVVVERVVGDVPGVAECSVIGVPHEKWGEAVCAVVVADGSVREEELRESILTTARQRLAGFQVPKEIRMVSSMPKTATGKIQKHTLRATING